MKKGFTLIELLAVILIIGILSSIALPQYKVVVEKARMTEAFVFGNAIADAEQRYIQANPNETQVCHWGDVADVDVKGATVLASGGHNGCDAFRTDHFYYALGGLDDTVQIFRKVSPTQDSLSEVAANHQYKIKYNRTTHEKSCECASGCADPGGRIPEAMCAFIEAM